MGTSRSLNMEPLVEVNNDYEMKIALELGAKVIGNKKIPTTLFPANFYCSYFFRNK